MQEASKAVVEKLETTDASQTPSLQVNGDVGSSSSPSSEGGERKRKLSNKEKFEFADLEKAIETLGDRAKELETLLAGAQDAGTG